jgi:hypothetical protein
MRIGVAIVAGLLLGGALGWWKLGHPGYETRAQAEERAARVAAEVEAARPEVYKWRDANGVLQLTDKPPAGRKYEEVVMREDLNVIPMSSPAEPDPAAADGAQAAR